jgi:glycosyltransferase involved in cell wall biosynthesis
LKSFFEVVDHFISPSYFLKQRYADWGIPPAKISVMENGQVYSGKVVDRGIMDEGYRIRFGYFGQLNPYKGIDVLLEAFYQLPKQVKKQVQLDVFGANLEIQTAGFIQKIKLLLEKTNGLAMNHGPYEHCELSALMGQVDCVIVPSIWWENSPMVIQEAFMHGLPVICSNIGGMAEKVTDGKNGLHFMVRKPSDLCEKIKLVASNRKILAELTANIRVPLTISESAAEHLALYHRFEKKKTERTALAPGDYSI